MSTDCSRHRQCNLFFNLLMLKLVVGAFSILSLSPSPLFRHIWCAWFTKLPILNLQNCYRSCVAAIVLVNHHQPFFHSLWFFWTTNLHHVLELGFIWRISQSSRTKPTRFCMTVAVHFYTELGPYLAIFSSLFCYLLVRSWLISISKLLGLISRSYRSFLC